MKFSKLYTILEAISPADIKAMMNGGENADDLQDCETVIKLDQPTKTSKHGNWGMSLATIDSCPFSGDCKKSCFKNQIETRFPEGVAEKTKNNMELVEAEKTTKKMADLLQRSILAERRAARSSIFRLHNGGDFFSGTYFDAWIEVANRMPNKLFYTYTTSIPLWVKRLDKLPSNFVITASYDTNEYGKKLILKHKLKTAIVVNTREQADYLDLEVDKIDDLAWGGDESFALLEHGGMTKNTEKQRITDIIILQ